MVEKVLACAKRKVGSERGSIWMDDVCMYWTQSRGVRGRSLLAVGTELEVAVAVCVVDSLLWYKAISFSFFAKPHFS